MSCARRLGACFRGTAPRSSSASTATSRAARSSAGGSLPGPPAGHPYRSRDRARSPAAGRRPAPARVYGPRWSRSPAACPPRGHDFLRGGAGIDPPARGAPPTGVSPQCPQRARHLPRPALWRVPWEKDPEGKPRTTKEKLAHARHMHEWRPSSGRQSRPSGARPSLGHRESSMTARLPRAWRDARR